MKKFVFYTFEGYTVSPTGKNLENIQILGFESGNTIQEAQEKLLNNSTWIEKTGFKKDKIEAQQLLDDRLRGLIKTLIEYNWETEQKHYEENPEENHIFLILQQLNEILFE